MSSKNRNILNWVLGGLVTLFFFFSASGKLMASPEVATMAEHYGLTPSDFTILGIIEVVSALLFLYPRTGVLGALLLIAYTGGAIATHLEHGEPIIPSMIIAAIIWIITVVRFPELTSRIMGRI